MSEDKQQEQQDSENYTSVSDCLFSIFCCRSVKTAPDVRGEPTVVPDPSSKPRGHVYCSISLKTPKRTEELGPVRDGKIMDAFTVPNQMDSERESSSGNGIEEDMVTRFEVGSPNPTIPEDDEEKDSDSEKRMNEINGQTKECKRK